MPQPDLEWTVMVYMAADNNLTPNAFQNLFQMSKVGSTERVHIVAQLDPDGIFSPAQRHFVSIGGGLMSENLLREPNAGSVDDFVSFVRWVVNNGHKAKKYLLVLWGHATGVSVNEDDESDDGNPVLALGGLQTDSPGNGAFTTASTKNSASASTEKLGAAARTAGPNGKGNAQPLMLLPDASSDDALTSRELREAVKRATKVLGVDKIDVLGMDACLMSMIEIARQVDNHASLMIASEESIPDKSWPYDPILSLLTQQPEITPQELSRAIVNEYLKFYETEDAGAVTLAACDLSKTEKLVAAMRNLAGKLRKNLELTRVRRAIIRARGGSQTFLISDFVDLFDLCKNLQTTLDPAGFKPATLPASPNELQACATIKEAAGEVMKVITDNQSPAESFVFHSGVQGGPRRSKRLENSHGVSIYFPLIVPLYRNLEFSRATQWDSFMFDYMNTVFRPAPDLTAAESPEAVNVAAAGGSIAPLPILGGKQ